MTNTGYVNTSLILHHHQPVDQFQWVIEEAYNQSYKPLLNSIEKADGLKVHMHFTGPLLEWLEEFKPDYLEKIASLVKQGRISIVGGGYSEPILSMIPEEFRTIQIEKLRSWWKTKYDIDVFGCWIAERVWEPSLAKSLYDANVDFIFVDDLFIKATGKSEKDTFYTYFTEDEGKGVHVIPINEPIRYLIPWKKAESTIEYLKKGITKNGEAMILIMSDAEKFGLWGAGKGRTTHDICYVSGYDGEPWIDKLFRLIVSNDHIKSVLIQEYMEINHSRGLIYIPSASYDKMGTWVLPTDDRVRIEKLLNYVKEENPDYSEDILKFTKGSFWRNFLVKYPEVNVMHKRVFLASNLYLQNKDHNYDKDLVLDEIISAQSNDAFWHGMFGGAYYRFMRKSVFEHAITAERLIRESNGLQKSTLIEEDDFLVNGRNEILMRNQLVDIFLSPFEGGTIFEIDDMQKSYNWTNVFSRRKEAYHDNKVPIDRWLRRSLRDHFFAINVRSDAIKADTFEEYGSVVDAIYRSEIKNGKIKMFANGTLKIKQKEYQLSITKTLMLSGSELLINYKVESDELDTQIHFSPELNFTLNSHEYKTNCIIEGSQAEDGQFLIDDGFKKNLTSVTLVDEFANSQIIIKYDKEVNLLSYPVKSYSYTDKGSEEQYQSTCLFPIIPFNGSLELNFSIIVDTVK